MHWLAYLCWPVAVAHTFGMGTDAGELWVIVLGAVSVAAVLAALIWRVAAVSRQRAARVADGSAVAVPEKHLALGGAVGGGEHRG